MFNDQQYIIPSIYKLKINRIYIPISKIFQNIHMMNSLIVNIPSATQRTRFNKKIIQQLTKAFNNEQYLASLSIPVQEQQVSIVPSSSSTQISIEHFMNKKNKTDPTLSSVIQIEQSLSLPLTQPIPHSIINSKPTTNRIFNATNSTYFLHSSEYVSLTPINSSSKKTLELLNTNDDKSFNHVRYYQIGSIFTSTSTFIMHQNEVIAHATASNPFLSDTIFIIIIATLTIIILLFCFGFFCLCRRTTKRNISPSFYGSSYTGLHGHSFTIPIDDDDYHHQQISNHKNDISSSSIQTKPSINHPSLMNDRILLPQTVALHHTAKQKAQISKNKLKKKRVGFCCCTSKKTKSTIVNAQTRIKRNDM
ncbi:unnamed protein product [Adineta steineri]|uniref:Uncharacterized protein n=1 Tax=Adineta steineri TaxID=433720 RepID=A0A814BL12_9BILA|nr:unnamed protein product [Adineta steineri]CAF0928052.1 unnamed protein product [Adineta steineri]